MDIEKLKEKAKMVKVKTAEMCVSKEKGHITSALSCAEIMTVLYYSIMNIDPKKPDWSERDRFVMSKNHGSVITYPILADLGFFEWNQLETYQDDGSSIGTHSKLALPGVEFGGGSLGIGLGVACGMALSAKAEKRTWKTYCLVGDCECHEGSIWESIMFAGHNKLQNLIMIIDRNGEGCTDFIENLIPLEPLKEKLEAFNWEVCEVEDGHSVEELCEKMKYVYKRESERPLCFVVNTIKGNGISFMQKVPWLHGQTPTGDKGLLALDELRR